MKRCGRNKVRIPRFIVVDVLLVVMVREWMWAHADPLYILINWGLRKAILRTEMIKIANNQSFELDLISSPLSPVLILEKLLFACRYCDWMPKDRISGSTQWLFDLRIATKMWEFVLAIASRRLEGFAIFHPPW